MPSVGRGGGTRFPPPCQVRARTGQAAPKTRVIRIVRVAECISEECDARVGPFIPWLTTVILAEARKHACKRYRIVCAAGVARRIRVSAPKLGVDLRHSGYSSVYAVDDIDKASSPAWLP